MKTKKKIATINIGKKIKDAREALDLTQQELGEKVFKTGAAIGYIERNERGISVEDLINFAKVLNVPLKYFFKSQISETILLQETLHKLQLQIKTLNKSLKEQQKTINTLTAALPRSEELRLITQSSLDPILLIDENCIVHYATKSIFALTGYHYSSVVGYAFSKLVAADQKTAITAFIKRVIAQGKVKNFETTIIKSNQQKVDIEMNAQLIKKDGKAYIHVVIRDISYRKKIQSKLEKNEQKYRAVLEQSQDTIILTDIEGNIIEWNQAAEKLSGFKKEQVLGKKIWQIQAEIKFANLSLRQIREKMKQIYSQMLRTKEPPKPGSFRITSMIDLNNSKKIIENHAFPVLTNEETFVGIIIRDISKLQEKNFSKS